MRIVSQLPNIASTNGSSGPLSRASNTSAHDELDDGANGRAPSSRSAATTPTRRRTGSDLPAQGSRRITMAGLPTTSFGSTTEVSGGIGLTDEAFDSSSSIRSSRGGARGEGGAPISARLQSIRFSSNSLSTSPLHRCSESGPGSNSKSRPSSTNFVSHLATVGQEALQRFQQGDTSDEESKEGVKLPQLLAASRRSLPRLKSGRLSGFIAHTDGLPAESTSDSEGERSSPSAGGTKIGPGGMPCKYDKKYYQPREDAVMNFASNLGLVRKEVNTDAGHKGLNPRSKAAAAGAMVTGQISMQGVKMSVLMRFAEQHQTELTTGEVVSQYIIPQTSQLRCRLIDLVGDKLTDTPGYYVVHYWGMKFKAFIDALKQYFALCKVSENDVVLWMDFYCVNQHRPLGTAEMPIIADIINNTDKVIFILDRSGLSLSRTWILWELYQVSLIDRKFMAAGSPSSVGTRLIVLPISWAWQDLYHSFITMDVLTSLTTDDRHRVMLKGELLKEATSAWVIEAVQEALRMGAKKTMGSASKLASVNPRRFIQTASTYAMVLYHSMRLTEAEDVMKSIKSLIDRASPREILPQDEGEYMLHLALVQRDKGVLQDAQRILSDFEIVFKDLNDELYLTGQAVLIDLHVALKAYTKAEMLCRKSMELRQKLMGRNNTGMIKSILQMSSISIAQHLYDEGHEHCLKALKLAHALTGTEGAEAACCYHQMAICYFNTNRQEEVKPLLERALRIRSQLLGPDHPVTLESQSLQARMLITAKRRAEAQELMEQIIKSRLNSYGPEHHDTLEALGELADLLRADEKDEEAQVYEKRIHDTGKELLKSARIQRFLSLRFISSFLVGREYLLEKAALFLAKAYIVYKEKLGSDSEMTLSTKKQLADIIAAATSMGTQALTNAELFNVAEHYVTAEEMLKRAWSLSRLINPEEQHQDIAQGLADALFAQDKIQEAKSVMRAAGLVKKGMKQNMPASYLRWLNKRVAKYIDKQGDDMDSFS